jgi:Mlc titration factor MtfA (ptsG expression regulator)
MSFFAKRRRAALRDTPLPAEAWATIDLNIPYVRALDAATRQELAGLVQIFLADKHFEGCGGLSLTDEIRITIAAQACVLLLHRESDVYPTVDTILVYPAPYRAPPPAPLVFARGPQVESAEPRAGEMSWKQGMVVLAWDHVRTETHVVPEGTNLVVHEFAHAIDSEDGAMDGAPPLSTRARYQRWAHVLGAEYADLARRFANGEVTDIRAYGATNEREFFAVVTEQFFEQPRELKMQHPEMYAELARFYLQDPASPGGDPSTIGDAP